MNRPANHVIQVAKIIIRGKRHTANHRLIKNPTTEMPGRVRNTQHPGDQPAAVLFKAGRTIIKAIPEERTLQGQAQPTGLTQVLPGAIPKDIRNLQTGVAELTQHPQGAAGAFQPLQPLQGPRAGVSLPPPDPEAPSALLQDPHLQGAKVQEAHQVAVEAGVAEDNITIL